MRTPKQQRRWEQFVERRRQLRARIKGTFWAACRGKQAFVLPEGAEARRREVLEREYCRNSELLEVYCCRFCMHWHIGHRPHSGSLNVSLQDVRLALK